MTRAIIELDARATVLDAADKLSAAPAEGDLALVVAPGAPILRNAVFLDVLRGMVGGRRLSIVTTDGRARSLASAAHVPAYSSLAALERHELDPTERLTPARRAAIARVRSSRERAGVTTGRLIGAIGSVAGAVVLLLAVVLPEARVTVSPTVEAIGPIELEVKGGGAGEVPADVLTADITVRIAIVATGERLTETKAKGEVRLRNKTTNDVAVPRGSVFSTAQGVQFLSTEDRRLPRSFIVGNFELRVGEVEVPIEAVVAGEAGNVAAGSIVNGPQPDRYTVTQDAATSGGVITRTPVMRPEDYDAAVAKAPAALDAEAQAQLRRWVEAPPRRQGAPLQVVQQVVVRQRTLAPARVDVIGKEQASIEMTVQGAATAYAVLGADFEREVLEALAQHLPPGREVAPGSALIEVEAVSASLDGVTWQVLVSAAHQAHTTRDAIGRLLAGRPAGEAEAILAAQGLRLAELEHSPSWWPLLPLLDGRIDVRIAGAPVTQGQ